MTPRNRIHHLTSADAPFTFALLLFGGLLAIELAMPMVGEPAESGGLADWLGFGRMSALLWLAMILVSFGVTGLGVQTLMDSVLGTTLPAWLAAIPAAGTAVGLTGRLGRGFARLLPQVQTEAVSERRLGRRSGVVSQALPRVGPGAGRDFRAGSGPPVPPRHA